jgi:hypothetical protein
MFHTADGRRATLPTLTGSATRDCPKLLP